MAVESDSSAVNTVVTLAGVFAGQFAFTLWNNFRTDKAAKAVIDATPSPKQATRTEGKIDTANDRILSVEAKVDAIEKRLEAEAFAKKSERQSDYIPIRNKKPGEP